MVKNNSIPFWRIIFTVLIALFHFMRLYGISGGWYISVEFFFITSGFLIMYAYKRNKERGVIDDSAWKFTKHRLSKLYPQYLLMFLILFVWMSYSLKYTVTQVFDFFMTGIYELLGIQMVGLNGSIYFNIITWYVSVLFLVGYFVYYMILNHEKFYVQFFVPISVIFIYSYYYRIYGSFEMWGISDGFFQHDALARGLADINMGIMSYVLCSKIANVKWKKAGTILLDIAEILGFVFIIVLSFFKGNTKYDFVIIIVMSLVVALAFGHRHANTIFNNKVVNYLSGLTYTMYLVHASVLNRFYGLFPKLSAIGIISFVLFLIVASIIINKVVDIIVRFAKKIVKSIFVKVE